MKKRFMAFFAAALLAVIGAACSGTPTGAIASPQSGASSSPPFDSSYSAWQRVLDGYVTQAGRVDYSALKAHPENLSRFVAQLRSISPSSSPAEFPSRTDQMTYWINAYNALVVKGVVDNWPVKSVLDIGALPHSFFWLRKQMVGGRAMTLDDIEKGILRKHFADPRVHFALNCASDSCPPLSRRAYLPAALDHQLDDAARAFINSPTGMKIDVAKNRVALSRIFKWYGGDFEQFERSRLGHHPGSGSLILDFVWRYAANENRRLLDSLRHPRIEFFDYDWGINAATAPPAKP